MLFGVSGHNKTYNCYPEKYLENQIELASELGSDIYRLNFSPVLTDENDLNYLNNVIDLCDKHGMALFLILHDRKFTPEDSEDYFFEYCRSLSDMYKGRIPYYQLSNEQDIPCLCEDSTGEYLRNYDLEYTKKVAGIIGAMCRGIKSGDPSAKTSVNISYKHSYFMNILTEQGVVWDISGLDWYSNMGSPDPTMGNLLMLPAKEIFVSEINTWGGSALASEDEQRAYYTEMINYFGNFPQVKAFMAYELLDEPNQEGLEKTFGLVNCGLNGEIGDKKNIFYHLKNEFTRNKRS